jgi:hypothetical protein
MCTISAKTTRTIAFTALDRIIASRFSDIGYLYVLNWFNFQNKRLECEGFMPQQREISLDVSLKLSDLYDPFKPSWQNLWRWAAAVAVFAFAMDLSFSRTSIPVDWSIRAVIWALAAFLIFALVLFPDLRIREAARKSNLFRETFRYVISAEGVHVEGENVRSDFKWSAFDRIEENESLFIFRRAPGGAIYLPKRCIAAPEDAATMRSLIAANFLGRCDLRSDTSPTTAFWR